MGNKTLRKRKWPRILLALFLGTMMGALGAEILVRLWHIEPVAIYLTGDFETGNKIQCYHEVYGWANMPGAKDQKISTMRGHPLLDFTISSQGFRDREFFWTPPKGVFRIAITGDSFTYGYSVNQEDTFSKVLERRLNEENPGRFEVINMGVSGYGSDQCLLTIERRVPLLRPHLVIYAFCHNDYFDCVSPEMYAFPKPVYRLDEKGSLVLYNVPVPLKDGRAFPPRYIFKRASLTWSKAYEFLAHAAVPDYRLGQVLAQVGLISFCPSWKTYSELQKEVAMEPLFLAQVDRMAQSCSAQGVRFAVLSIPTKGQEYLADAEPMPVLQKMRGRGIEVITTADAFRKAGHTAAAVCLTADSGALDGHWNNTGHALAAEVLFKRLKESRLVP